MSLLTDAAPPRKWAIGDVIAGISVAFIAVPQGLAYAELAGLPSYAGLYAAALPPLVAALWASSRYLQTGPVAMTALLTYGALSSLATPGSPEYVELALLLAVIVGVARLGLGFLKGGALTYYMSHPVILGFTTGAVLLIIASQLAVVFGVVDAPDDLLERAWVVLSGPSDWNAQALSVGIATGIVVVLSRRVNPLIPGVLIAVVGGLLVGGLTDYTGELVGSVPEGFPPLSLAMPWSKIPQLIVPGVIIAIVGFADVTAISRTLAAQDRERWDANRELVSQGLANLAAGVSGGFPVGGSFARSMVGKQAGARTRWNGAVTGLAVLLFTPFAGVLGDLPRAVLGAIVIVSVANILRLPDMVRLIRVSWGQSVVAWLTFAATLVLSPRIDLAVLFGVLLAGIVHVYRESSRLVVRSEYVEPVLRLWPSGVLFYASAPALDRALGELLVTHPRTTEVVLDLRRLGRIDHSGMLVLQDFAHDVRAAGLEITAVNIPRHAGGIWNRMGGLDGDTRRSTLD